MFERFTERSRTVVAAAQEEAVLLEHDSIGTGHIPLGIVREGEGAGARILQELGADAGGVRTEIDCAAAGTAARIPNVLLMSPG